MSRGRATMLAAACAVLGALPVRAQERPAIRAAVRLAGAGRGDSARALLNGELRRSPAGSAAWIEVLYWRGRLGSSGDSAERDFRRVAIEYSSSAWADDALLQLAQLALAGGNAAGAYDLATRLRSDYPGSELRPAGALWAARAAFVTGEARSACALLDTARTESATDVEFVNQVEFYRARCGGLAALPPAAPRPADSTARGADPAAPSGATRFEVQAAATRAPAAARDVADRLARAGYRARVETSADGMHRVRVGPFATRGAAEAAAAAARRIAGGAPFLVSVP